MHPAVRALLRLPPNRPVTMDPDESDAGPAASCYRLQDRVGLMSSGFVGDLTIFVLALLVGFEVISKVPATLHTPLMSGANSIHGVVLVGVVLLSAFVTGPLGYILLFIAAAFGAANVVGGYLVTDRMLGMFRRRPLAEAESRSGRAMTDGVDTAVRLGVAGRSGVLRSRLAPDELPGNRAPGQPGLRIRYGRRPRRGVRRGSARRNDVGRPAGSCSSPGFSSAARPASTRPARFP